MTRTPDTRRAHASYGQAESEETAGAACARALAPGTATRKMVPSTTNLIEEIMVDNRKEWNESLLGLE